MNFPGLKRSSRRAKKRTASTLPFRIQFSRFPKNTFRLRSISSIPNLFHFVFPVANRNTRCCTRSDTRWVNIELRKPVPMKFIVWISPRPPFNQPFNFGHFDRLKLNYRHLIFKLSNSGQYSNLSSGLYHEQSRSDRDQTIAVLWDNLSKGYAAQFAMSRDQNFSTGYDVMSVRLAETFFLREWARF